MKLFAIHNDTQAPLLTEFFLPFVEGCSCFDVHVKRIGAFSDGNFLGTGYRECLLARNEEFTKFLREHGEAVISDIDVIWFNPWSFCAEIEQMRRSKPDVIFAQESVDAENRQVNPAISWWKWNEKTEALLKFLHGRLSHNEASNDMWHLNEAIQWNIVPGLQHMRFPHNLVSATTTGGCKTTSACYHANFTLANSMASKLSMLKQARDRYGSRLVVASYKEDLGWTKHWPGPISVYRTGARTRSVNPRAHCLLMQNKGREASQYLRHIIDHYPNFRFHEVFCQGDPFAHCGANFLDRVLHGEHWGKDFHSYGPYIEFSKGRAGLPWIYHDDWAVEYCERFLDDRRPEKWPLSAHFAVARSRLLAHPKEHYEKWLKIVLEDDRSPWAVERLWEVII